VREGIPSPVELAVLLKAVPRSEVVRYDPAQKTLVREGVELVVNPFDQRALRVALELRRPGERVTVVSLGPPPVAPLLREARAVGADRALHLCDAAFAGSDVLATSSALAAALRRLRPGLVLGGARSTDSDTGLIGPEVAARLGVPVVTLARALRRPSDGGAFEVDVDTPGGWATVEVDPPAVITVGEKIAKPLPVTPEQFARAAEMGLTTAGPADVGLSPAEVGAFGSPTTVVAVEEVAPVRRGRRWADGPVRDRVEGAVSALLPLLEPTVGTSAPLPWPPAEEKGNEIVLLASGADGGVEPGTASLLSYLRRALPVHWVTVAGYGPEWDEDAPCRLSRSGALGGYTLDFAGLPVDSADVARGLASLLELPRKLAAVVALASPFGREVAGQLAAARGLGAVGDATGVRAADAGELAWSKPSFGGTTVATIRCRSAPVVATMPAGLAHPVSDARPAEGARWSRLTAPAPKGAVRRREAHDEPAEPPEVDGAEVVVAVGSGVGGPEGIARLTPAVRRWGAALVATRRVVDAGWMPVRRQVGLTGRLIAPRLAVLLGVRGATNHMVGWARAKAVLAVNRDPEAPVFRQADVGIVGTVEEVVPDLVGPLEQAIRSRLPPPRAS
jgi:electron transfer flavoprotein alpha subunit